MFGLHSFTDDSTMTWDKPCLGLLARVYERIADGLEKDPLPGLDSYCAVHAVFKEHDLLTRCVNSP